MRLAALTAVVSPVLGLGTVRAAQGELGTRSLVIGRELSTLLKDFDRFSVLKINGNSVLAGGSHVEANLDSVLDRFEAHCTEFAWDAQKEFSAMATGKSEAKPAQASRAEKPWSLTLARKRSESEGLVVCLAPSEKQTGISKFVESARVAFETGELSSVGQIRYLYARKHARSGTNVVAVLTTGDFNMHRFMSVEGDAPGDDLDEVPRPQHSRRIFQAELAGSPYVVRSYTTPTSAAQVLDGYQRSLPVRAWKKIEGYPNATQNSVTFEKDGAAVLIQAAKEGESTRVDIVQMGSRGSVSVFGNGASK
jgi:hypothetical protein